MYISKKCNIWTGKGNIINIKHKFSLKLQKKQRLFYTLLTGVVANRLGSISEKIMTLCRKSLDLFTVNNFIYMYVQNNFHKTSFSKHVFTIIMKSLLGSSQDWKHQQSKLDSKWYILRPKFKMISNIILESNYVDMEEVITLFKCSDVSEQILLW